MMNMSEKARIAYTGPALADGVMDIRELAPSLLAFAELIENANEALGKEQKIQVLLNQDSFQYQWRYVTYSLLYPTNGTK